MLEHVVFLWLLWLVPDSLFPELLRLSLGILTSHQLNNFSLGKKRLLHNNGFDHPLPTKKIKIKFYHKVFYHNLYQKGQVNMKVLKITMFLCRSR